MALDLRPLTLGELFDRAFSMYRHHLWMFAGVAAVPAVLALAATLMMQTAQMLAAKQAVAPSPADPLAGQPVAALVALFGGMLLVMIAYWIVYMVALGATTFAVSEVYVGRTVTIAQVYRRMRGRIGPLVLLMLLIGLRLFGITLIAGIIFAVVVGGASAAHPILAALMILLLVALGGLCYAYMMLRYAVCVPALVIERLSASESIKRSIELTHGRLLRVLLLVACAMMVTLATTLIFQGPFTLAALMAGPGSTHFLWLNVVGSVVGTIGATFTTPFLIIGLALIYYDARIRDEGLDLELTLAAIDTPASA